MDPDEPEQPSDSWFDDLLGGIGDLFGGLGSALADLGSGIINGLVSFLTDPLGSIVDCFNWVKDFLINLVSSLVSALGDLLKMLFVPSDTYFSNKIDSLNVDLQNHVDVTTYQNVMNSLTRVKSARSIPNIDVDIWGDKLVLVDFTYIQSQQETINNWVRGFMFIFLVLFNINHVYKIIRKDTLSDTGSGVNPSTGGGKK